MKFKVTMKDPDGPYDSICDAVEKSLADTTLSPREKTWWYNNAKAT